MRLLKHRPSPAMVVAMIALFVAMSGVGYAASVADNSVGTKALKSRAVTGDKIAKNTILGSRIINGTIKGKDINMSQLGTVPSASTAGSFATVTAGGALQRNRNVTSVNKIGPGAGNYQVNFNQNVSACAYWVSTGSTTPLQPVPPGFASVAPAPANVNAVVVSTFDGAGGNGPLDRDFYLLVLC